MTRKVLANAIKAAKHKFWADLIATVDTNIWGKPYRMFTKRLGRRKQIPGIELPGRLAGIVDALFPA